MQRAGRSAGSGRQNVAVDLRLAIPEDELAVAEVGVASWQVAYRGLLPDAYLDGLRPKDRAARYRFASDEPGGATTMLAVEDGVLCGFAASGPSRDADVPDAGELRALYAHPDWWGRGVGRMLIAATRTRLGEHGHGTALLWVLVGNTRAERFYEADGWRPDGSRRLETLHGITVHEHRYQRVLP